MKVLVVAGGTPNAIIQSSPWGYQNYSGSAIYDGISWFRVSDTTGVHGATKNNCSIGTVDGAHFSDTLVGVTKWCLTQVSTDLFQMVVSYQLFKKIGMVLVGQ